LLLLPEVLVEEVELVELLVDPALVDPAEVSPLVDPLVLGEAVESEVSPLLLPLGALMLPLGLEPEDEPLGVWLVDPVVPPLEGVCVEDGLELDGVCVVSVLLVLGVLVLPVELLGVVDWSGV